MYLLKRLISAYTAADRLLGVFSTETEAEGARQTYLEHLQHDDPWAKQGYREPSPEDVKVVADIPEINITSAARRVFVVSEYAEGFGQIVRMFIAICTAESDAHRIATEVEARSEQKTFPAYCEVDDVEVGVLLPDAQERCRQ